MKKILLSVCVTSFLCTVNAQNCGQRYKDFVFNNTNVEEVTYSTSNQKMDIYTPIGDVGTNRAVIVWAHGGSFVSGTKADHDVATLADNFAKRGYVTVSIDYSLAGSPFAMLDSSTAYEPVMVAVGEAKAALRYLRANAATYAIDTNNIFFGGNSAGAILGLNYGFMDNMSKATPLLTTAINNHGGLEGDFGNPGYSSKFKALVSLAGGILYPDWIDGQSDIPTLLCQGDMDGTVPYNCGPVLGGASTIRLCGSNVVEPALTAASIASEKHVWVGGDHCPWSTDDVELAKVDTIVRDFLYSYVTPSEVCTGINEVYNNKLISVYPNPAQSVINISLENAPAAIQSVRVSNVLGQTAYSGTETKVSTQSLQNGLYFVEVTFKDNQRAIKRVEVLK